MLDISGDRPAIAGLHIMRMATDRQDNMAGDEVAGLLVRMLMDSQRLALIHPKLSQHRINTIDHRLTPNSIHYSDIAFIARFLHHMLSQDISPEHNNDSLSNKFIEPR